MSIRGRVPAHEMRHAAGDATAALRVLANPDRLLLLCHLSHGEHCVSELEAALDIQQPTLSQQLGVLRRKGLVATSKKGKYVYYRVADKAALTLISTLYALYCKPPAKKARRRVAALICSAGARRRA
jgi:DNA-binding transcriptional ArsR family regulator